MKPLNLICLCLLLVAVTAKPSDVLHCNLKADVVFIIDSSRSIWEPDYELELDFLANITNDLNVGPMDTHIGALSFSEIAQVEFYLDEMMDVSELQDTIRAVPFMQGNMTNTHLAFQLAREKLFNPNRGARRDVPRIIIIVTDGASRNRKATKNEADILRNQGVQVFVVGIGRLDPLQLAEMATENTNNYVHTVRSFSSLDTLLTQIVPAACKAATTTPMIPPNITPASWTKGPMMMKDEARDVCTTKKADVVFVLDKSSSIMMSHFRTQLSFVNDVMSIFNIGEDHTHVSVVTFDTEAQVEFGLRQYYTRSEIMKAVLNIEYTAGATNTFLALEEVATNVLSAKGGVRKEVAHVVIVVTDGMSSDTGKTAYWAKTLKDSGAYVFAIGVGSEYDHKELTSIASEPTANFTFQVKEGYGALNRIKDILAARACEVPSSDLFVRCMESPNPADVMFTTYYGRAAVTDVTRTTELIKNVAGGIMTSDGKVRVGAVSSECPDLRDVRLDETSSAAHFAKVFGHQYEGRISNVLRRSRDLLTVQKFGARHGVKRVNVVFVYGSVDDIRAAKSEVMRAKFSGVEFIFVGMGPYSVEDQLFEMGKRRRSDIVRVLMEDVEEEEMSWQDVLTEVCTVLES